MAGSPGLFPPDCPSLGVHGVDREKTCLGGHKSFFNPNGLGSAWLHLHREFYHYTLMSVRVCVCVCTSGRSPEGSWPRCKKLCYSAKLNYISWLTNTASNGTSSRLNQAFQKRMEQTEIDKRTHQWQPEGDERAMFGIQGCPRVLHRGRRFCAGCLLPRILSSKACYTSDECSWLMSHMAGLPECAHVRLERTDLTLSISWSAKYYYRSLPGKRPGSCYG